MFIKNTHILIALLFVFALGILVLTGFFYQKMKPEVLASQNLEEILAQRESWRRDLKLRGADWLWQKLKENYQDNYHRHSVAHIYGELLYEELGIKGVGACDESFSWGCYHAFFGRVLAEKGLGILPELDGACREKSAGFDSGCQHGIGHGLAQYMGSGKLLEALSYCDQISVSGDSCATGVFMESNFPTEVIGVSGTALVRQLNPLSPYEPCYSVPEKYRGSCFYELPRLWERVFNSDFEKIGELCGGIGNRAYQQKCFAGTGEVVSLITDHHVGRTIEECGQMPDGESISLCRIAASWGFFSLPEHKKEAFAVCDGLDKEVQAKCASVEN